jgi:hypothetical protein
MKTKLNYITLAISLFAICFSIYAFKKSTLDATTEFMQITAVESVVPGGLGRSKMITISDKGAMGEMKLENFFSMVGINFENIRMNDNLITNKITDLTNEGWSLKFVNTGVYGADKSTGIYITRYIFSRQK